MFKVLLSVLLFKVVFSKVDNQPEKDLILKLMKDYDRRARPVTNSSETIHIKYSLKLAEIQSVDERNQRLSVFALHAMTWTDEYLKWDPRKFNGIKRTTLPAHNIWLPDVVQENSAKEFYNEQFIKYFKVELFFTGEVVYSPGGRFTTSCSLVMQLFPFDSQSCKVVITSWTYTCDRLEFDISSDKLDLSNYQNNSEWDLTSTKVRKTVWLSEGYKFCSVEITLNIKRKPLYFILIIVLPCIMLSFISVFTFCIPPEVGERITLSMTVLLSYTVFLLVLNDILPRNSDHAPIIALYILIVMLLTGISLICTIIVVRLYFRKADNPDKSDTLYQLKWRKITRILDYAFFGIFTAAMIITFVTMFSIVPAVYRE